MKIPQLFNDNWIVACMGGARFYLYEFTSAEERGDGINDFVEHSLDIDDLERAVRRYGTEDADAVLDDLLGTASSYWTNDEKYPAEFDAMLSGVIDDYEHGRLFAIGWDSTIIERLLARLRREEDAMRAEFEHRHAVEDGAEED